MNYVIRLCIFYPLNQLSDYQASFLLLYGASLLEKAAQIEAVSIFLNHIDLFRGLDCLIMPDTILTSNQTMYFNFFENLLPLSVADVLSIEYFTGIHCFAAIDG